MTEGGKIAGCQHPKFDRATCKSQLPALENKDLDKTCGRYGSQLGLFMSKILGQLNER